MVKRVAGHALELRGCRSVHSGLSPIVSVDVTPLSRLATGNPFTMLWQLAMLAAIRREGQSLLGPGA